ncbi:hypothetical protein KM043_005813 [Ampulex compressa]|nr:hypothetical protein KM043_005813 [Ampulex compressa]
MDIPNQYPSYLDNVTEFMNLTEAEYLRLMLGPKYLPLTLVLPITLAYAAIFITGVFGNVVTCIVIRRNPAMQTATNYYLFNLAVSDLLLLVLDLSPSRRSVAAFLFTSKPSRKQYRAPDCFASWCRLSGLPNELSVFWQQYPWKLGIGMCKIRAYVSEMSSYVSVLTIVAFSSERYLAICHPLHLYAMSGLKRPIRFILGAWLVALIFALPFAVYTTVNYVEYPPTQRVLRNLNFGGRKKASPTAAPGYITLFTTTSYVIDDAVQTAPSPGRETKVLARWWMAVKLMPDTRANKCEQLSAAANIRARGSRRGVGPPCRGYTSLPLVINVRRIMDIPSVKTMRQVALLTVPSICNLLRCAPWSGNNSEDSAVCAMLLPNMPNFPLYELSCFIFFLLPMMFIAVLYIRMGFRIQNNALGHSIEGSVHGETRQAQSRKAIIRMLSAVVITFFICWAPFHAQRLLYVHQISAFGDINEWLYPLGGCLYYFSTTANPILYNVMSAKYRVAFKETLCCSPSSPSITRDDLSSMRDTAVCGYGSRRGSQVVRVRSLHYQRSVKCNAPERVKDMLRGSVRLRREGKNEDDVTGTTKSTIEETNNIADTNVAMGSFLVEPKKSSFVAQSRNGRPRCQTSKIEDGAPPSETRI